MEEDPFQELLADLSVLAEAEADASGRSEQERRMLLKFASDIEQADCPATAVSVTEDLGPSDFPRSAAFYSASWINEDAD